MWSPEIVSVNLGLLLAQGAKLGGETMIVPNPELIAYEARERRRVLMSEADHVRLRRIGRVARTPRLLGLRRHVGAWLIAMGRRLSADVPVMPSKPMPTA